jgi:NitT/TauT family transport system ATP-binding protein
MFEKKNPFFKIENLSFAYDTKTILQCVELEMEKGEIAALIGVSGSGKSTLFKLIVGILEPFTGSIKIENLPRQCSHISYMMQEDLLLPWRTIIGNLTLPAELGISSPSKKELQREARILLEEMGLLQTENLYPSQLSGGMRQRISLARALLQKRPLLLLDEPFGSLDFQLRDQMYVLLRKIHAQNQTTMLLVTHDFRDALCLADSIYHLSNGQLCKKWRISPSLRKDPDGLATLQKTIKADLVEAFPF